MSEENRILKLLRLAGELFPETPDEIEEMDKIVKNLEVPQSKHWDNPEQILENSSDGTLTLNSLKSSEIQDYAAAAREGKSISKSVKDKMKKDRKDAGK